MGKFKDQGYPDAALVEECAEVIQVISKTMRFGGSWDDIPSGHTETRWQQLENEMDDLLYQWERLKKSRENNINLPVAMSF
jgi:NTP pyrophosphatase (non-canonical NTP hydrolase)